MPYLLVVIDFDVVVVFKEILDFAAWFYHRNNYTCQNMSVFWLCRLTAGLVVGMMHSKSQHFFGNVLQVHDVRSGRDNFVFFAMGK